MNSLEFLAEVDSSGIGSKDFASTFQRFSFYQALANSALKELHRICEKHQICYELAFGSLLGIIRDGGQIPWDYDIDVIIPVHERKRLVEALTNELSDQFYFNSIENNDGCQHVIIRIAPKGISSEYLHVDIFFVMGLARGEKEAKYQKKRIKKLAIMYRAKSFKLFDSKKVPRKEKILLLYYQFLGINKTRGELFAEYKSIAEKYSISNAERFCLADRFSEWYDFPIDLLTNTKLIVVNNDTFRIPVDYESLLFQLYGDYKVLPSLATRIHEVELHTAYLDSTGYLSNLKVSST